jgi:hypothetical protein
MLAFQPHRLDLVGLEQDVLVAGDLIALDDVFPGTSPMSGTALRYCTRLPLGRWIMRKLIWEDDSTAL